MLDDLFLRHPRSIGENYAQHFATAFEVGLRLVAAGAACLVHAFLPALFERTASRTVSALHTRMVVNRQRMPIADIDYAI